MVCNSITFQTLYWNATQQHLTSNVILFDEMETRRFKSRRFEPSRAKLWVNLNSQSDRKYWHTFHWLQTNSISFIHFNQMKDKRRSFHHWQQTQTNTHTRTQRTHLMQMNMNGWKIIKVELLMITADNLVSHSHNLYHRIQCAHKQCLQICCFVLLCFTSSSSCSYAAATAVERPVLLKTQHLLRKSNWIIAIIWFWFNALSRLKSKI